MRVHIAYALNIARFTMEDVTRYQCVLSRLCFCLLYSLYMQFCYVPLGVFTYIVLIKMIY